MATIKFCLFLVKHIGVSTEPIFSYWSPTCADQETDDETEN